MRVCNTVPFLREYTIDGRVFLTYIPVNLHLTCNFVESLESLSEVLPDFKLLSPTIMVRV